MSDDLIKRSDAIEAVSISCRTCLARDIEDCKKCSVPKLRELINAIPSADRPQDICEYGEYCMCATCHYQEDCSNCADCVSNNKQMHDIWTCTKYMRKEYLRKGSCDTPTIEIMAHGNCARCGKPIEGNSIFLCNECKSLMKGADDEA